MNKEVIGQELIEALDDTRVYIDASMSKWTSFKTGGNADFLACPKDVEEIKSIIEIAKKNNVKFIIIGNGTNILVRDGGIKGIVIGLYQHFNKVNIDEESGVIIMNSGALLSAVANYACRQGLAGMEFASGIPGCVGGAVRMNAGAYGGEMKDIIQSVTILHKNGEIKKYTNEEMQFGYRNSIVTSDDIVIQAIIKLNLDDSNKIRSRMVDLSKKRKGKQPVNMPSAGSAFKRPEGGYAGTLIDEAGLKGYTVGGAQVSKKHAGFVVNTGKATASDVEHILEDIQEKVYEHSGFKLEKEIIIIGEEE